MAMYQDRIFAFTPKGELIQLPKGATPVDFAYAVHTDLGDQTVGAKINGRVMPLRTPLDNGDQVEILVSKAQHPQPAWLSYVVTGKARAKIRRWVKSKEREETVALGRKIFDEIVQRLPAPARLGSDRRGAAPPASAQRRGADGGDRAEADRRRRGHGSADAGLGDQGRASSRRRSAPPSRSRA